MSAALKFEVIKKFVDLYGHNPEAIIFAPGRINLIGEHTDYSDGFVLPVAINLGIYLAVSPTNKNIIEIFSIDFNESGQIDLSDFTEGNKEWLEYLKGIINVFHEKGHQLVGWQGVIAGNLPIGAGLSSSAAAELAWIKACSLASGMDIPAPEMAKIGRKAEKEWVGVNVGIMDQLISAAGRKNHAMLLDCRTLEFSHLKIPNSIRLFVLDTQTRRELSHSSYNIRYKEVDQAAKILGISTLRDASLSMLEKQGNKLSEVLYKRTRHVITENMRVKAFCKAMQTNDSERMGTLINKSHASLRDDYEVSSKELNAIVSIAQKQPGCLGARMTGAGFGGCAIAITEDQDNSQFVESIRNQYMLETHIEPDIFQVSSAEGVHIVG